MSDSSSSRVTALASLLLLRLSARKTNKLAAGPTRAAGHGTAGMVTFIAASFA
jgi:hypothetical protein